MNKEQKHSLIFFIILEVLVFFILIRKNTIDINLTNGIVFGLILAGLILSSKFLYPVFKLLLKITSKIGSVIFFLITSLVFYLILTPISFFMRIFGKKFVIYKYDKSAKSYYDTYKPSEDIKKQF